MQCSTGEASRSLDRTEPAQDQACIRRPDTSILSNVSHPGETSNHSIPRLRPESGLGGGYGTVAAMNIHGGRGIPISVYDGEAISHDWLSSGQSYTGAQAHSNYPWQHNGSAIADVAYCLPPLFRASSKDRPSFGDGLERIASPFDDVNRFALNTLFTPPAPDPSNTDADTLELEDPPELRCDVEGCDASFVGIYRNGNLGRHRRQKHVDLESYECEALVCDTFFSSQDARLKHYRASHPELTSSHTAHEIDRIKCPNGCPTTFGRGGEYRRHMMMHERPRYRCPVIDCPKTFSRADKLRDHAKKGHGGRNPLGL